FDEALTRMVAQAGRELTPLALIAIDLDHFKSINDHHGHDVGDHVLGAVAGAMSTTVRGSDLVARVGGEEFAVLAPDTDGGGAAIVAEHVRAALSETRIPGLTRGVTASFGIAVL